MKYIKLFKEKTLIHILGLKINEELLLKLRGFYVIHTHVQYENCINRMLLECYVFVVLIGYNNYGFLWLFNCFY